MKKIIFFLITTASLLMAGANHADKVGVYWKAFKTFEKIGVDGKFTELTFTPKTQKSKDLHSLLLGSKISINSSKIETNNVGRNKKVSNLFFGNLKGKTIKGEIIETKAKSLNSGTLIVKITMNEKDVKIPMAYSFDFKHSELVANGTIDIFDFSGNDALKAINKECFDLHQGKTWNDVDIEFRINIKGYAVKGIKGIFG